MEREEILCKPSLALTVIILKKILHLQSYPLGGLTVFKQSITTTDSMTVYLPVPLSAFIFKEVENFKINCLSYANIYFHPLTSLILSTCGIEP